MDAAAPLKAGAMGAITFMALTACTSSTRDSPSAEPSPEQLISATNPAAVELLPSEIAQRGSITVAMDATYVPFEYIDEETGDLIGVDVDLARLIAAKLGITAEHTNAGFDTIIPGLAANKFDAALSAISVTSERDEVVDFVPYLRAGSGLAVQAGNPLELAMDPMTLCGHNIAAPKGTIQVLDQLPEISDQCVSAGEEAVQISVFPSQNETNLAVISGRADAAMAASISLIQQIKMTDGRLELAPGDDYDAKPIGIALPEGSDLKPAVELAVEDILDSPDFTELLLKWGLPETARLNGAA